LSPLFVVLVVDPVAATMQHDEVIWYAPQASRNNNNNNSNSNNNSNNEELQLEMLFAVTVLALCSRSPLFLSLSRLTSRVLPPPPGSNPHDNDDAAYLHTAFAARVLSASTVM
jgi:hypothetical protein